MQPSAGSTAAAPKSSVPPLGPEALAQAEANKLEEAAKRATEYIELLDGQGSPEAKRAKLQDAITKTLGDSMQWVHTQA